MVPVAHSTTVPTPPWAVSRSRKMVDRNGFIMKKRSTKNEASRMKQREADLARIAMADLPWVLLGLRDRVEMYSGREHEIGVFVGVGMEAIATNSVPDWTCELRPDSIFIVDARSNGATDKCFFISVNLGQCLSRRLSRHVSSSEVGKKVN
jgi:hypothetical protein